MDHKIFLISEIQLPGALIRSCQNVLRVLDISGSSFGRSVNVEWSMLFTGTSELETLRLDNCRGLYFAETLRVGPRFSTIVILYAFLGLPLAFIVFLRGQRQISREALPWLLVKRCQSLGIASQ